MKIAERLDKVLAGKYRIERLIGAGGMGVVYAASHRLTHEQVAVKFLRSEFASEEALTRRFVKEAQTIAQLKHPNAVRLIDLDIDPEWGMYMVLELLSGEALDEHLAHVKRIPLESVCEWLLPVMDVLERAHARGVLHRDVKPANIFLHQEADGAITTKLLDFGLVRVMGDRFGSGTKPGQPLGTPSYMSPEQAHAEHDVGPETDVWSMGVVLYRCLSGIEPFDRGSVQSTVLAVVSGDFKPLREACPELPGVEVLEEVVHKALRVARHERTPSMAVLSAQLVAARDQLAVRRALDGVPARLAPTPRIAAVAGAFALTLGAAWWLLRAPDAAEQARPAAESGAPEPQPPRAASEPAVDQPTQTATAEPSASNPVPPRAASDAAVEAPRENKPFELPKKPRARSEDLDLGEILVR